MFEYKIKQKTAELFIAFSALACVTALFVQNSIFFQKTSGFAILILFVLWTASILKNWKSLARITIITIAIEAIGKYTGWIFGSYSYAENFSQIGILNVPLFIGLAWYLLVTCVSRITQNRWLTVIGVVGIDFLLEPFATVQNIWTWDPAGLIFTAPIQNYIAWGIITYALYPYVTIESNKKNTREIVILATLILYILSTLVLTRI